MYLTDYHVHSDVSMDSDAPMWDMVEAEAAAGIDAMCFTNHCDIIRSMNFQPNPRCLQIIPESREKLEAMFAAHHVPIEVRLGIELAEVRYDPELAKELAATEGLDFVLGSMHTLPELGDLVIQFYSTPAQCDCYFAMYLEEYQKVAEMDFYDVLAHFGYARRYMWRAGVDAAMTLDKYGDQVEHLLRTVIDKGKGFEINCSGIRDGCGPFPSEEILRLYRSMGGEILTIGSDAHRPKDAAAGIRQGFETAKACGFDYVTVFRQRKPEFIKL